MVNILLSTYDFNNSYCFSKLKEYLRSNMKVVVLPFTHSFEYYFKEELFNELYDYDIGRELPYITRPFHDYGIEKENIYVLNPFRDSTVFMKYKIQQADILFFTGGNPINFMALIKVFDIEKELKDFKGITIGASAGAMLQLEEFFVYYLPWEEYPYEYFKGLGYVRGIDIMVHWENNEWQNIAKIMSHIERRIPFINLPNGECLIYKKEVK